MNFRGQRVHPVNAKLSFSQQAGAWIANGVQMGKNLPEIRDLVPSLAFVGDYQIRDKEGRLVERYMQEFFDLEWFEIDTVSDSSFSEVEVCGNRLFIHASTLQELEGKQLVLATVEVGYPTPADKTRQLLKAVPKTS